MFNKDTLSVWHKGIWEAQTRQSFVKNHKDFNVTNFMHLDSCVLKRILELKRILKLKSFKV